MLVLTRTQNESIIIGDDIVITLLPGGKGGQQRIGIEAPKHIRVDREEIKQLRDAEFQCPADHK